MNSFLLNRQLGSISHSAFATAQHHRLISSIQTTSDVHFYLKKPEVPDPAATNVVDGQTSGKKPHPAGVNSIAVDRFEGRYLLSAGADSSIAIWDLEAATPTHSGNNISNGILHTPLGHVARSSTTNPLSLTHITFYPFDSLAFLTSSPSQYLQLFSSETLQTSASFHLDSPIYSHATSNISPHLLVACATAHPAVRLVDLRSGSATHSLAGHAGSVLSVAWHPKDENVLVSGATDGSIRVWDVRRSASSLGVLDKEDNVGLGGYDGKGTGARGRERGKAHAGPVNGVVWGDDGRHLVSVGHDERMRVWDVQTAANTLAHFGAGMKNAQTVALYPLLAPRSMTAGGKEVVFYPNPKEILVFDLFGGRLLSRLRTGMQHRTEAGGAGVRSSLQRTTSLAWRVGHVEMYSAHADGEIRCWRPRTWEDRVVEEEEKQERDGGDGAGDSGERKRKREELEQIVRDLTGKKITYS